MRKHKAAKESLSSGLVAAWIPNEGSATSGLLELFEVYAPAEEGHHPRLLGWTATPVSGYNIAAMVEIKVTDAVIWPPMLHAALVARGSLRVFRLSRPGTMVRFFVEGKTC